MKKCPYCGATLNDDDNFCIFCGKDVRQDSVFNAERICPNCKTRINEDDKYCPNCGTEVNGDNTYQSKTSKEKMSAFKCYSLYIKNGFNFKGRATRREYWSVFFINLLLSYVFTLIEQFVPALVYVNNSPELLEILEEPLQFGYISSIIFPLLTFIPTLSLTVRRLRDVGKPWTAYFINLIPVVGEFIFFLYLVRPSNYYGYRK